MAESDASLIFDVDYDTTSKKIEEQLKSIIQNLESSSVTKLKFSIDEDSLKQIQDTISGLSNGLVFDSNGLQQNMNFKPIQPEITPVKIPTNFVGTRGQSIESLVAQMQNQIGKIAQSPVKVKIQSDTDDKGNIEKTKATIEYINKDLGITEQQIYSIEKAGDTLKATLKSINVLSDKKSNIVNTSKENESLKTMSANIKKTQIDLDSLSKKLQSISRDYQYDEITPGTANKTLSQINDKIAEFSDTSRTFKQRKKDYEEIISLVSRLRSEISNLNLQEKQFVKSDTKSSKINTYIDKAQSQIDIYKNTISKFSSLSSSNGQELYTEISSTVRSMQDELNKYNEGSKSMKEKAAAYEKLIGLSSTYKQQLEALNVELRNENANSASNTKMTNLQNQISSIWDKHGATIKTNEEAYKAFQEVQSKINIGLGKSGGYANVKVAGEEVANLKKVLTETGVITDGLSTKMRKLFDVHLKTAITMMGIHALQQGFSQLVDNVKEIDSALTQLKIVSGESEIAIEKFADKAFKAAEKIGSSATDIMFSTETWSRLGYSLNDSLSLATTTAQFSNVGNISVEDATTSMTAILKAYSKDKQNAPEDAQKIADILTNVGEKYAISASELGEALKAGGASLEAANTNLEQSVALMAAGNAAVQDSSKVGNALKTTSMRIRGATAELSDAGEEVDDFCESTSKMQETIKGLSGVDIMEKDGKTFRSIYDIMVDISNVFDKLSDVNQASLLEALAGKRNATVVKSIITNIKDLQGAYEDAQNASGTVGKANAEYMDSIEGKLNTFTAKFQEFSSAVTNTDIFKGLIDGGTVFVDVLQQILTFGDGIVAKIGLIVGIVGLGSAIKLGRFMPSLPEDKNNGTVIKLVNCWEVCEYYNYKVA